MTTQQEYSRGYDELYGFVQRTLENEFKLKGAVLPSAALSDDLGLEPIDWFILADFVERKYDIEFKPGDLALFDYDAPRVDGFVRMVLVRLNCQQPLDDEAYGVVLTILEEIIGLEPFEITPDQSFADDMGIDSMTMIEILMRCEDKLDVKIADEALHDFDTVRSLVDYLSQRRLAHLAA